MSLDAPAAPAEHARRRGPVDPRLWHYSRSARGYLLLTVALSLVTAGTVIVSALMIGTVLAGVITDPDARTPAAWGTELAVLAAAVAVRTASTWAHARYAHRSASRVIGELRGEVLEAAAELPPRELDPRRGELATVLTRGIEGLRAYLTGYLPALMLAVTVTPLTLLVILFADRTSAVIIALTLPLVPVFMILIGLLTKGKAAASLTTMTALSAQLLDLLAGLPTLRALGRERGPAARVRALGDAHRHTTMSALRIAFLSAMVLELLATLCVALVAVSIGLRLVFGGMELRGGVIALILAAEVYLPLRMVGAQFHAAEDGMAAAEKAFGVLDEREPVVAGEGDRAVPLGPIVLRAVGVRARGQWAPRGLDAVLEPGRVTVLTGANGSGKSTVLHLILGLADPDEGEVSVGGVPVRALDAEQWWREVAWLPQHPVLIPGTLRENLELTGPVASDVDAVDRACAATGFDTVLADLSDGWQTRVGVGGLGLSLGQRQRLALTRVLLSDATVVLLDEPTAHLDPATEATVLRSVCGLAARGRTVVMVGHRDTVLRAGDEVVLVEAADGADPISEVPA
ncbi:thiol reductant ABC exporter subunit CydD [Rhodococcus oryzae]|uniref:Thiol reductant ABC exporter subunit CydD n=1 Tax=Rhodococcus oryzae TaxID=2571143 RepID=A0ABY2RHJ7_9NOCA|nr:thiol reductant ABC exporter subunit CydD [Rhodococcus oryzae]TJZ76648.1 thiol reductant ABC exporter subunit CydD [Rhodococcus oryzae]